MLWYAHCNAPYILGGVASSFVFVVSLTHLLKMLKLFFRSLVLWSYPNWDAVCSALVSCLEGQNMSVCTKRCWLDLDPISELEKVTEARVELLGLLFLVCLVWASIRVLLIHSWKEIFIFPRSRLHFHALFLAFKRWDLLTVHEFKIVGGVVLHSDSFRGCGCHTLS